MQNPRALWASCQKYFQQNIEVNEYQTWFSQVEFETYTPATCTLILSVPSDYVAQYIEKNYIDHLRTAISNTFGRIRLKWHTIIVKKEDSVTTNTSAPQTKRGGKGFGYTYEGAVDTESGDGQAKAALATNNQQELIQAPGSVITTHLPEIDSQLNLHQTFSNYVEGASNKLCRSVGLSIAEHPQGTQFNPLFIYGPSGCGKTTLLKILCGLRKPQKGQLAGLPQKPAVVFQEDRLLPWYTAEENVEFVGKNALQWLQFVGLEKEAKLYPKELSGGMQRRVALARAFSMEYDTLLLDEPFTGLDEESIKKIAEHIREVSKNTLVVLVTHKKEEADENVKKFLEQEKEKILLLKLL